MMLRKMIQKYHMLQKIDGPDSGDHKNLIRVQNQIGVNCGHCWNRLKIIQTTVLLK